jgi:tetratricopeptide (TPR) repeat protein
MPYLQEPETADPRTGRAPVRYARSDHSVSIPRPRADSAVGIVSACASCHAARTTGQLESEVRAWWGVGKPVPAQVTAQLAAARAGREAARGRGASVNSAADSALTELLGGAGDSPGRPHRAATFAGLARYLESVPGPDAKRLSAADRDRLAVLSSDPDADIRALALATRHLTGGADAPVRRALARSLTREGAHDFALRSRWAVALGYMGDRYAEAGDFSAARTTYGRALEVMPANARLRQSLGNAERSAGDYRAAITSYEGALLLERRSALIMVNLGIALGAAGDSVRGEEMFRAATQTDPGEPLGWFNLGNVALLKGDYAAAAKDFQRAVAIDGALAQAHFQLARIHLLRGDNRSALQELRQGLAVDSSDAAARATTRQLEVARKR